LRRGPSPQAAFDFEQGLKRLLDGIGRRIVEWTYNRVEPHDVSQLPPRVRLGLDEFRRNRKTPRRIACLFGPIRLWRCVYQAVLPGEAGVFPLEHALGIVLHLATPALADVVGRLVASSTQQQVLAVLRESHGVRWSVGTLRKITAALAELMSPLRHDAQITRLLELLRKAAKSRGRFPITLAVGRDGVMVPLRPFWEEAAAATVSVYDRLGKRLGTVYLGRMPELGQHTLTEQLTRLLTDVLRKWRGALPRLVYITDAGSHPQEYFRGTLASMRHPRTGQRLKWQWIVDFFHACEYVGKIAEAIFGSGGEAHAWAEKMCHILKHKTAGVHRVLCSARALAQRRGLRGCPKSFRAAMSYLRKYRRHMNYASYRRRGLPIGSGVTEAACKMIFNQRFKQSGMRWKREQAQHVLDLRVLLKSGVWPAAFQTWLKQSPLPKRATPAPNRPKNRHKDPEYALSA
jgi:hypothetical protein